jgi:hypothetical protein
MSGDKLRAALSAEFRRRRRGRRSGSCRRRRDRRCRGRRAPRRASRRLAARFRDVGARDGVRCVAEGARRAREDGLRAALAARARLPLERGEERRARRDEVAREALLRAAAVEVERRPRERDGPPSLHRRADGRGVSALVARGEDFRARELGDEAREDVGRVEARAREREEVELVAPAGGGARGAGGG